MSAVEAQRDLESRIDSATIRLATAPTIEGRRSAWDELVQLVRQRSPERIREMERERGLTP